MVNCIHYQIIPTTIQIFLCPTRACAQHNTPVQRCSKYFPCTGLFRQTPAPPFLFIRPVNAGKRILQSARIKVCHRASLHKPSCLRTCSAVRSSFNSLAIRGLCLKHAVDSWRILHWGRHVTSWKFCSPVAGRLLCCSSVLSIFSGIWTSVLLHKLNLWQTLQTIF